MKEIYRDIRGRFMSREAAEKATEELLDQFFKYFHKVSIPHLKRMTKFWDKHYPKFLKEER